MDENMDTMSSVRLILIRHGETDVNTAGCFLGDLDVPLNPHGLSVVQSLAQSIVLWKDPIRVILSSPLQRARQTADIIAAQLDHVTIVTEPNLREMSFGSWEGKTSREVATFPSEAADLAKWKQRHPEPTVGPTNGETLGQVGARVEQMLNSWTQQYPGQTLIVVTHVYVIKAALDRAMELPDGYHANRLWLDTASATIIDWNATPAKRTVHRVNWTPLLESGSQKWLKI
jgi:broad specificity phosphatase PhoE